MDQEPDHIYVMLTLCFLLQEKAHKAMEYLWMSRHRASDLVGTVINIHNGDWVRRGEVQVQVFPSCLGAHTYMLY